MHASLLLEQLLNGVQFGMTLFLMAAGLTLIFGIMNLINLAHGSLYMIGAYVAASSYAAWHSVLAALALAISATAVVGIVLELGIFRALYDRDHLDQVLATFGLILFFNEAVADDLGRDRALRGSAAVPRRAGRTPARRAATRLPARDHRRRAGGRAVPLSARRPHAHRHADPCRRLEPHHDRRARRQHPSALHAHLRPRRRRSRRCRARWRGRSSPSNPAWATTS